MCCYGGIQIKSFGSRNIIVSLEYYNSAKKYTPQWADIKSIEVEIKWF